MKFIEAVTTIIEKAQMPLSPVEIREQIKNDFPEFYDTNQNGVMSLLLILLKNSLRYFHKSIQILTSP